MAGFFKKLLQRFTRRKVDLDELEESLITGDVGIRMTTQILDRLRAMGRSLDPEEVVDVCREEMRKILPAENPPLRVPAASTRWQGTTGATGLWPRACPTARAAPGSPRAVATSP